MRLLRNIYSDWMKTKNTPIRLIIYITPVIYSILMLWYASYRGTQAYTYSVFFEVMAISFPIAEAILCALICKLEEEAGDFINILSSESRISSYLSKFLLIALTTIFVVFMSTTLLLIGMNFVLHISNIQYFQFFWGACLAILGSLFVIEMHLIISLAFGLGASISIGGAGFLVAAIIGGSLAGNGIWIYFPWAWSVRLIYMVGSSISQILYICLTIIVLTIIAFFLSIIWFNTWEGKKSYE